MTSLYCNVTFKSRKRQHLHQDVTIPQNIRRDSVSYHKYTIFAQLYARGIYITSTSLWNEDKCKKHPEHYWKCYSRYKTWCEKRFKVCTDTHLTAAGTAWPRKCLLFPSKFEIVVKYQSAGTLESKACVTELQFSLVQRTRLSGLQVLRCSSTDGGWEAGRRKWCEWAARGEEKK